MQRGCIGAGTGFRRSDSGQSGRFRVRFALSKVAMNFSATQGLRLKHALEAEGGFRVGFLGLFFLK